LKETLTKSIVCGDINAIYIYGGNWQSNGNLRMICLLFRKKHIKKCVGFWILKRVLKKIKVDNWFVKKLEVYCKNKKLENIFIKKKNWNSATCDMPALEVTSHHMVASSIWRPPCYLEAIVGLLEIVVAATGRQCQHHQFFFNNIKFFF
jgi:hypothetical protein